MFVHQFVSEFDAEKLINLKDLIVDGAAVTIMTFLAKINYTNNCDEWFNGPVLHVT